MIIEYNGKRPQIAEDAFIAPNATIIGNVTIGSQASVWFGAVIRGDSGQIMIGDRTNVQDNAVIHVNETHDTCIETDVTIGHAVVLEGCQIGAGSLIGMNATVLSGATVGAGALVAAGSVVRESQKIPAQMLAAGVPAKVKGALSAESRERLQSASEHYRIRARSYQASLRYLDS